MGVRRPSRFWYLVRALICMIWAIPWMVAAFVLALSIVGIPLVPIFVAIGCAPFGWNEHRRVMALLRWENRDHEYQEDEEPPWVV